jgi:transposase
VLEFDLLFRAGLSDRPDDATWDHPTFSKDRQPLLEGNFAAGLLSAVLSQLRVTGLVSTDHF